jgi:hypothetical protein
VKIWPKWDEREGGDKLDLDGGEEDEWLESVVARWEVDTFLGGTS